MATTVNVLCYKSKTLGNGEHPLMVCVCMDGKRKYKSLGVSVRAEHWNFEKNIPKSNCPNKEYINILIASLQDTISETCLLYTSSLDNCEFSSRSFS